MNAYIGDKKWVLITMIYNIDFILKNLIKPFLYCPNCPLSMNRLRKSSIKAIKINTQNKTLIIVRSPLFIFFIIAWNRFFCKSFYKVLFFWIIWKYCTKNCANILFTVICILYTMYIMTLRIFWKFEMLLIMILYTVYKVEKRKRVLTLFTTLS